MIPVPSELTLEKIKSLQEDGLCICCEKPAIPKCYSPLGIREYHISGLCELCYDELFEED